MKTTQCFDYTRKRPDRAQIKEDLIKTVIQKPEKIDGQGNIVSMTIEHAKDNAGLWEFSYHEMSRQTA